MRLPETLEDLEANFQASLRQLAGRIDEVPSQQDLTAALNLGRPVRIVLQTEGAVRFVVEDVTDNGAILLRCGTADVRSRLDRYERTLTRIATIK